MQDRVKAIEMEVKDHEKRLRFLEKWAAAIGGGMSVAVVLWEILRGELMKAKTLIPGLLMFAAIVASGQDKANCKLDYDLRGSASTRGLDNTRPGCAYWVFTYSGSNPVTVQTSADGSSWSSSVLTVASGTMPTTSGYGRVILTGYAPYLRVTGSGTNAQSTQGTLYGTIGLQVNQGSSVPDYVWDLGTPVSLASWTPDAGTFTVAIPTGKKVVTITVPRTTASGYRMVCTTYPTPPFTARFAVQMPTQYWNNDAAKSFVIAGRDPTATKWLAATVAQQGQYWEPKRCTGGVNPGDCSTIASYWGSPFFTNILMNQSTNWPAVFQWKDDGTTIYLSGYDPISGLDLPGFADDHPKTDKTYVTPTQLCYGVYKANGNYTARYNIVGYSLSSP